jgi:alpha-tubulin suppressor-like RCC1 family protein
LTVAGVGTSDGGVVGCAEQPDGTLCNDGNACTQLDVCVQGTCVGTSPASCATPDQCHEGVGTCDPATGLCGYPVKADGSSCDDGNACTQSDTCQGGICTSGVPVICAALDPCHIAGACNNSTGTCTNPNAPDGTSCDDGNPATPHDSCQMGICVGSVCSSIIEVEAGGNTTCAVRSDGTLWCWGQDVSGSSNVSVQKQIPGNSWRTASVGQFSSLACAIDSEANLWCWGSNTYGQLGNGTQTDSSLPVKLSEGAWTSVAAGAYHACAIRTDGTLWCWGANLMGQLGSGWSMMYSSVPVQVIGANWTAVSTGAYSTCGVRADGSLWCWGVDNASFDSSAVPTQVSGSQWRSVSLAFSHACATQQDDTLWWWGDNSYGQLGEGTDPSSEVPVQVPGLGSMPIG